MAYKVIGDYGDETEMELGTYPTIERARDAIAWQGQPRGDWDWLNADRTVARVNNTGGRHSYTVIFRIEENT